MKTPGELDSLNQLSKVHMNTQRLKHQEWAYKGLHQITCIYIKAFSLVFLSETHSLASCGKRVLRTHSSKWDVSIKLESSLMINTTANNTLNFE